jgi:hypothetical protein
MSISIKNLVLDFDIFPMRDAFIDYFFFGVVFSIV